MENYEGRIELIIETDKNIQGDPHELLSAFTNLMVNALKYSPQDTPVTIRWNRVAAGACLEVEDHGEGITEENIPRITERFYRVDVKRNRIINGTGLGLAIVKHVLLRHNAKLDITSSVGGGSCFRCLFPNRQLC
jgi:two-component system phosphate regulon sensor histidine kinase PhoR